MLLLILLAQIGITPPSDSSVIKTTSQGIHYYVSPIGNDGNPGTLGQPWRTLLKAVNTMEPGDTTFVRGGTYDAFVPIGWDAGNEYDGRSARSGTPTAPITLRAYPDERVVLTNDQSWPAASRSRYSMIDIRERSYWVIEGFTFNHTMRPGASLWWCYGVYVVGPAKGVVIRKNLFEGNGLMRVGGTVINVIYDVQDTVIENNTFQNWPSASDVMGVTLETDWRNSEDKALPNRNTVIRGNTFEGLGGDGVQVAPWGGYNTLIENNVFRAKYDDGNNGTAENAIDIKRSFFTTIRGNMMGGFRPKYSNPRGEAILVHLMAEDVTIERNTIYDCGGGITIAAGNPDSALPTPSWYTGSKRVERVVIRRNLIVDINKNAAFDGRAGFGRGIDVNGVNGLKIFHNVIAFADTTALALEEARYIEIRNNIFYRSYHGLVDDTREGTNFSDVIVGANLFDVDGQRIVFRAANGNMVKKDLAGFKSMTGQAAGSRIATSTLDPITDTVFVYPVRDMAVADFRLKHRSLAIDIGDLIPGENEDYLGSGPDMGFAEYDMSSEQPAEDAVRGAAVGRR